MSRIRTIKPEYWVNAQVMDCTHSARLLFIGLWNFCDDGGVHPANARQLKAEVFPGDDVTLRMIVEWVTELVNNKLLIEFAHEDEAYWYVTGWKHQKIDRPSYKYPQYKGKNINSTNDRRMIDERSTNDHPRIGQDRTGQEGKGKDRTGQEVNSTNNPGKTPTDESAQQDQDEKASYPDPVFSENFFLKNFDLLAWAENEGITVDLRDQTRKFLDRIRDKTPRNPVNAWKGWIKKAQSWADDERSSSPQGSAEDPVPPWRKPFPKSGYPEGWDPERDLPEELRPSVMAKAGKLRAVK